jgi:hypothetical protein
MPYRLLREIQCLILAADINSPVGSPGANANTLLVAHKCELGQAV